MGYIYKVNTYGYKVVWWDWQSGSRNRWCKAYKWRVGKKKNRYGANVNERTSHLRSDCWSKIDIYRWPHHLLQNTASPKYPRQKTKWISGQNTRTIFQIWLKTGSNLEWNWEVIDSCCSRIHLSQHFRELENIFWIFNSNYYANLPPMNTITGCVPYLARYPCKVFLSTWKCQLKCYSLFEINRY